MCPSLPPSSSRPATDPDLVEQALPGHGVPSQDPDPAAQKPLTPSEAERESESVLMGGALVAGAAAGAVIGAAVAGPVGVVVGGTVGSVAGALGAAAAAPHAHHAPASASDTPDTAPAPDASKAKRQGPSA